MKFRKSSLGDIKNIMDIIKDAQYYFKSASIDQWQDDYPNENVIKNDILNETSYIIEINNAIAAAFSLSFNVEGTYKNIYEGNWLSKGKYAVLHRLAVQDKYKGRGIATEVLKKAKEISLSNGIHSIKIDTHRKNSPMKKLLLKNGFLYCGVIYLEDNSERLAFEKTF
ncbi:GNAT family N-acetyltransferase [Haloimpatiens sp. FM7315]|uniref:GNAT family N-acetyltransferase n=1 Tax=Haloimpatiens sp. FM7315 TaxID=3298609 RepID=UPI00370CC052